ncbi:MAG: hypothetical protein Ct9H300mP23_07310 [Nitrospinota bacterium]|nr:MAG: hypothetical protein Ct9H300mP23_07310 [Nitrospinota bacterium]
MKVMKKFGCSRNKDTADPDKVMSSLFQTHRLDSNFQINFTCLKPKGTGTVILNRNLPGVP